jgi:hypothetical protein
MRYSLLSRKSIAANQLSLIGHRYVMRYMLLIVIYARELEATGHFPEMFRTLHDRARGS